MKHISNLENHAAKIDHRTCVSEIMLIFPDLGFDDRIQTEMRQIKIFEKNQVALEKTEWERI